MIKVIVIGEAAMQQALDRYAREFSRTDMVTATGKAALKATDAAASFTPPGEKQRRIVKKTYHVDKERVSKRTDTTRYASHFVKIMRQKKKPLYVPVNLTGYEDQFGNPPRRGNDKRPADPNFAAYDSARKRKTRVKTGPFSKYQSTRKSTQEDRKGQYKMYDTQGEIAKLRKIGRHGLAFQAWKRLGKKAYSKEVKPFKKTVKEAMINKWTDFDKKQTATSMDIMMHNKLTYMKKAYGDFEPFIMRRAAEFLEKEIDKRLERRAAKENQRKVA